MSYFLSINDGHEAGITLFEDNKILFSIAEERLTRIKSDGGFPTESINNAFALNRINKGDIKEYIYASKHMFAHRLFEDKFKNPNVSYFSNTQKAFFFYQHFILKSKLFRNISFKINKLGAERNIGRKAKFVEHHKTHAYSAYITSGFKNCLAITCDAVGDGLSASVNIFNNGKFERLYACSALHSPGQFYGEITELLGFNPRRHGGKVTGLAALGNPEKAYDKVSKLFSLSHNKRDFVVNSWLTKNLKNRLYRDLLKYSKEDIAAATQKRFEDVILGFVENAIDETGIGNIALAGGSFANVKLNHRILNLDKVNAVHIHPGMTDCGINMGAGFAYLAENNGLRPFKLKDVYFGSSYTNEAIKAELGKSNLEYRYHDDIEGQVAELLNKNKVVARFNHRMEYGPRALGNRSILYTTTEPSVNDWLNKHLHRSDFMPFAPVTIERYAKKCYLDIKGGEHAAKFMTICFECTDWMKETSPAVVHVDNTARPQFIEKSDNPSYFRIVDEYRKITGIPSLINTSFNMHEEPIVCSPSDAIRSFKLGHLDYLAIGNYLVKR